MEDKPISAREAVALLDSLITVTAVFCGGKGKSAQMIACWHGWLIQIRPHLVRATDLSNDR